MLSAEVLLHGVSLSEEMQVDVGDPRRTRRVQRVVAALAKVPDKSYPEAFGDDSELEAFYRLIRNPYVSVDQVLATHREQTAERSRQVGQVLVIHDTTEYAFSLRDGRLRKNLCKFSNTRQGFLAHTSLVASADGLRAPLGVVGLRPYAHTNGLADEEAHRFWALEYGQLETESDRWHEAVESAETALADVETVIHVMDREGDIYGLMAPMRQHDHRFVIRAAQDRVVEDEQEENTRLFEALEGQPVVATRRVELSARSASNRPPKERRRFPVRRSRQGTLAFRAVSVTVHRPQNRPDLNHLPETMQVNVVEAVEVDAPEGEEPVRWVLLTTEPIDTVEDVLRVVDLYRSRWLIEEFFKAVSTGCSYKKRQLDTAQHLLIALALTLPVAWHLLVLRHLERQCPEAPAEAVVNETQLLLLKDALPKWSWSAEPTVGEATRAIAKLGGHLKSNGRPGWQTLGRGYQKLLEMEAGWDAAMRRFKEMAHQE